MGITVGNYFFGYTVDSIGSFVIYTNIILRYRSLFTKYNLKRFKKMVNYNKSVIITVFIFKYKFIINNNKGLFILE